MRLTGSLNMLTGRFPYAIHTLDQRECPDRMCIPIYLDELFHVEVWRVLVWWCPSTSTLSEENIRLVEVAPPFSRCVATTFNDVDIYGDDDAESILL